MSTVYSGQHLAPDQSSADMNTGKREFSPRIISLDVLRGLALLGGVFVSIWIFGGFSENQQNGLLLTSKGFNYRLFGAVDILFNGKMRALISIVFGAGMLLFLTKENRKDGMPAADLYVRRMMWLMAFGLLNGLLFLWTGDILFHLGLMGILLFPFVRLSARWLLIASVLTMLIYSGKNYWKFTENQKAYHKYAVAIDAEKKLAAIPPHTVSAGRGTTEMKREELTGEQKKDKAGWEGIVNSMKFDPRKDDAEKNAIREGSYGSLWNHLLPSLQWKEAQWTYQTGIWDFGSMIFLGMALFKFGFYSRFSNKKYLLIGLASLIAGVLLGWFRLYNNQLRLQDFVKFFSTRSLPYHFFFPFERALISLGYACTILYFINAGWFKFLWSALAATGRLALTNYLVQSMVCTIYFTGYGMGYFGRLEQYQLYLFAAEICTTQIAFSVLWLRQYNTGPVEWLWRCLIEGKKLPFAKRKPETKSNITVLS